MEHPMQPPSLTVEPEPYQSSSEFSSPSSAKKATSKSKMHSSTSLLAQDGTLDLSDVPLDVKPIPRSSTRITSTWSSKYKGVCRNGSRKWKAHINHHGVLLYLGTFDTQEEAAVMFARAHYKLHGPSEGGKKGSPRSAHKARRQQPATVETKPTPPSARREQEQQSTANMFYPGLQRMSAAASFLEQQQYQQQQQYVPFTPTMGMFPPTTPFPAMQPGPQQQRERVKEYSKEKTVRESEQHNATSTSSGIALQDRDSEEVYLAETIRSLAKELRTKPVTSSVTQSAKQQPSSSTIGNKRARESSSHSQRPAKQQQQYFAMPPYPLMGWEGMPTMFPTGTAAAGYFYVQQQQQQQHQPTGFPSVAMAGTPQQQQQQMMMMMYPMMSSPTAAAGLMPMGAHQPTGMMHGGMAGGFPPRMMETSSSNPTDKSPSKGSNHRRQH